MHKFIFINWSAFPGAYFLNVISNDPIGQISFRLSNTHIGMAYSRCVVDNVWKIGALNLAWPWPIHKLFYFIGG